jgi:thiol-disulfide isomerase/thioredoxin
MKIRYLITAISVSAAAAGLYAIHATRADAIKSDQPAASIETLPPARGGQDLLGTKFPDLHFQRWLNTDNNKPAATADSVTLYRWWTDTCPFCAATMPAIESLRQKYGPRGLKVVAVYHPKPPRQVKDENVLAAATRIGYKGPIAIDADWSQLKAVWLTAGRRAATSVSFLVDRQGVIRFVHPGVQFYPSDKPEEAQENHDFQLIEKGIESLLGEE